MREQQLRKNCRKTKEEEEKEDKNRSMKAFINNYTLNRKTTGRK